MTAAVATIAPQTDAHQAAGVRWTEVAPGSHVGQINGREAKATVIDHGYAAVAQLTHGGPLLGSQESHSVAVAKNAAAHWLDLIV
jgi:hypothetical protein